MSEINAAYQKAAQDALDCQDACNLSGVVFSFAEAMHAICDAQQLIGESTKWKNTHPIVTLFLSKLSDLNGCGWMEADYYKAHEKVKHIAKTGDIRF
jgi:hypothetical protein